MRKYKKCYCVKDQLDKLMRYSTIDNKKFEPFKLYEFYDGYNRSLSHYYKIVDINAFGNLSFEIDEFDKYFAIINERKLKLFLNNLWKPKNEKEFKIYNDYINLYNL